MSSSGCCSCGRCCYGPEAYVRVFEEDLLALGQARSAELVVASGGDGESFMRMEGGHCAALCCSGGRFYCSVYEQRPLICRVYQVQGADSRCPPSENPLPPPNPDRSPPVKAPTLSRAT